MTTNMDSNDKKRQKLSIIYYHVVKCSKNATRSIILNTDSINTAKTAEIKHGLPLRDGKNKAKIEHV